MLVLASFFFSTSIFFFKLWFYTLYECSTTISICGSQCFLYYLSQLFLCIFLLSKQNSFLTVSENTVCLMLYDTCQPVGKNNIEANKSTKNIRINDITRSSLLVISLSLVQVTYVFVKSNIHISKYVYVCNPRLLNGRIQDLSKYLDIPNQSAINLSQVPLLGYFWKHINNQPIFIICILSLCFIKWIKRTSERWVGVFHKD